MSKRNAAKKSALPQEQLHSATPKTPNGDKAAYVYDVFQSVASVYDEANARISLGQHLRWKRKAVRIHLAGLPAQPRLLDLGCGTGDMLLLLHEAAPDAQVTGLDFSPEMLAQARVRCAGLPSLSLVQGDAQELPFDDASFDGVCISFALRNTSDYARVLAEAFRVLRPGGSFMCIDSFVPAMPLVRPFYHLYFSCVMPLVGGGLRNWRQYRWLSKSTRQFVSVRELKALMRDAGYGDIASTSFMMGASACVRGLRPDGAPATR